MSRNRALEELARMTFPKEEEEARKKPIGICSGRRGRQTAASSNNRPASAANNRPTPTSASANRPRQHTRLGLALVASQGNNPRYVEDLHEVILRYKIQESE